MKNFVQPGDVLTLTAPYDRAGGQGALIGAIFGVAAGDVANGQEGEFRLVGVYDLEKVAAEAWNQGDAVYWDDSARLVTTVPTDNTPIGVAVAPAGSGSATGRVRLNGSF
jgi:predicted RecA/RadA family phage recombinase